MFLRFLLSLLLLVAVLLAANFGHLVRFSFSGMLGVINLIIVIFLLLLTIRHFILLYFSTFHILRNELTTVPAKLPGVSIICPAFNESVVILDTLRRLTQLNYPEYEVIVVDDGSSDDTFAKALKFSEDHPRIKVYRKANQGKGMALNFGIAKAGFEIVFCMDADSQLDDGALEAGVKHFSDPEVAAVAGSVLVLNTKNYLTRFQAVEYLTGLNFFKRAQSLLGFITVIPGPSGMFRKEALQKVKGYTADTFAEDCDLTLNLVISGHKVCFEPQMLVRTEVPENILALIKQRYRWNRGILQALKKHMNHAVKPFSNKVGFALMWYLMAETIALPVINITVAFLSLIYTIFTLDFSLLSLWLIQLTLLDLAVIMYSLSDRRWPLSLIFVGLFNRFTYAFALDIVRLLSMVEEFFGISMNWGKLERVGSKS